jgi:Glycosyltransferase family 87
MSAPAIRALGPANLGRSPALVAGLVVALLAGLALTLTHRAPRSAFPPRAAIQAALHNPDVTKLLAATRWDRVVATPVDGHIERVSFFLGGKIVAEAAVTRAGAVQRIVDFTKARVPYGNWIAYQPAVLIGLGMLFVLMTAVSPWRRIRNLDVLAALSLIAPVIVLERRYVGATALSAAPGLGYLTARCAWRALGAARPPEGSTPLLLHLTRSWNAAERVRVLRITLLALALVFAMVGVSSTSPVDVIYAAMEGATKLIHGVLPYGHMPGDVVHGDTYPILSYAFYAPLAWLAPVGGMWDSVDPALGVTALAALATAAALYVAAAGRGGPRICGRSPEAECPGLRAAVAWLAFPPLLITVSTGSTDVILAALLVFAVVLWRRPGSSAALIAAAGWFKLAPFALVPVWLAPLRGRALVRAIVAIVAVSAPALLVLVALGGLRGPAEMLHAIYFQFSRDSSQSIWAALGIRFLQPLGQGCVLGLIAAVAFKLYRQPWLAAEQERMAAAAAAILIGLQLAADYWAFLYLVWIVPLFGLSLLATERSESNARLQDSAAVLALGPAAARVR